MTDSIAEAVNQFYEENPFPGYEVTKYRSRRDLGRLSSWYARLLDATIPYGADVADVGCGTGQLTCFLGCKGRSVTGFDFTRASLAKAEALRDRVGLDNVRFQWADVLNLDVPDASFDYVFCNGVLHHTPDPRRGFAHVVRICRPGGFVTVGLYNRYGRAALMARRRVLALMSLLDPEAEKKETEGLFTSRDQSKKQIYFADQYQHPHESTHGVGEVMKWFAEEGLTYVNSFPPVELLRKPTPMEHPFELPEAGAWRRSLPAVGLKQFAWVFTLGNAGGYFAMVGRKGS